MEMTTESFLPSLRMFPVPATLVLMGLTDMPTSPRWHRLQSYPAPGFRGSETKVQSVLLQN